MKNIIEKILAYFASIPQDKLLHYIMGAFIDLFLIGVAIHFAPLWLAFVIADVITVLILILKEVYDSKHAGHSAEFADVIAGIYGIITMNFAALLILL